MDDRSSTGLRRGDCPGRSPGKGIGNLVMVKLDRTNAVLTTDCSDSIGIKAETGEQSRIPTPWFDVLYFVSVLSVVNYSGVSGIPGEGRTDNREAGNLVILKMAGRDRQI